MDQIPGVSDEHLHKLEIKPNGNDKSQDQFIINQFYKDVSAKHDIHISGFYKVKEKFIHRKEFQARLKQCSQETKQKEEAIIGLGIHGTSIKHVQSIIKNGFLAERNKTSMGGKGTYCTIKAAEALMYCENNRKGNDLMTAFSVQYAEGNTANATSIHSAQNLPKDKTHTFLVFHNPSYRCVPVDHGVIPTHLFLFDYKKVKQN